MSSLATLIPGNATPTRQACASGDAVSLVVLQPAHPGDRVLVDVVVEAEFDNAIVHRIGEITLHPTPRVGARVVAAACVPGARAYRATWRVTSSRDTNMRAGLHASIGGAGHFGLRNLDLLDDGRSETLIRGLGSPTIVSGDPLVVAEMFGHNDGAACFFQVFDGITPAGPPLEQFFVPAGAPWHRSYPPHVFRNGLTVARSSTWDVYTHDPSGTARVVVRTLVR